MPCWDPRQPPRGWSYQGSAPTPPGLGCSPLPLGNLLPGPGAGLGRSHSPPPASSLACGGRDRARGAAQPSLSLDSPQRSGRILVPMDGPGWTAPPNASVPPPNETGCGERADFQYVLFPVVYSLVFVLGLAGNGSVLWYFLRTRTATAPANVFLANLAALDLLFVLTLPFRAGYHALRNDWPFGEATCKLTGSLFYANLYGSSLFLSCICLERYVAVVHPLRSLRLRRPLYRVAACLAVWALLAAAGLYLALRGPLTRPFPDGRLACLENFSSDSWRGRISGVSLFAAAVGFLLPLTVIGVCYPLIARRLLDTPGMAPGSRAARRKALRTVLVVLAVFLICFAPYHLTQVVHTLGRVGALQGCRLLRGTYVARRVTMALTSLNACLDPLVYYCAAERFAWSPPCRAGCCTGRPASSGDTQGTGLRALDNGASRGAQAVTGTSSHDKA
ncbi:lysophosphatidic acid receptor 6-like isoform X4 [Mauremys mutica]|nr:lysophosphatidic acid receptor 6-like isoform X4 [Mauremys mutica]